MKYSSLHSVRWLALVMNVTFLMSSLVVLGQTNTLTAFDEVGYTPAIPPSPEAGSLGKYGQYQVNLAHGIPNIDLPLFEVNSGHLKLPLSLSYHAGGNKIKDEGSWIGLGWTLNAGGVITRVVRGLADDDPSVASDGSFRTQAGSAWYMDGLTDNEVARAETVVSGGSDTEPDQFSFNFNGNSGSFYFDNSGGILVVPYQPLTITPTYGSCGSDLPGCFSSFEIETPEKIRYIFSEFEVTDSGSGRSSERKKFASSWYLTKIIHPNGFDKITFKYRSLGSKRLPDERVYLKRYQSANPLNYGLMSAPPNSFISIEVKDEKRLDSIIFNNGKVDIGSNFIKMYSLESNSPVYDVSLSISEFPRASDCATNDCHRKKLNSLTINGNKHSFYYNEDYPQPSYNSHAIDHWGYFNNAANDSPIPSFVLRGVSYGDGANRNVSENASQFCILQKIVYPTGGFTTFEYESNRVSQVENGMERVNIDSEQRFILRSDGGTTGSSYGILSDYSSSSYTRKEWEWPRESEPLPMATSTTVAASTTASEITFNPQLEANIEYWTTIGNNGQPVGYTKPPAVILNVDGAIDGVNTNYNSYQSEFIQDEYAVRTDRRIISLQHSTYVGTGGMEGTISLGTTGEGNYVRVTLKRTGYYLSEPTGDSDIMVGGLRIKSITNHDTSGEMMTKKSYTYSQFDSPKISSAVLMNAVLEDLIGLQPYYERYGIEVNTGYGCIEPDFPFKLTVHSNPQGRMTNGYSVGYENITEKMEGSEGAENGETRYVYHMQMVKDQMPNGYPVTPLISKSFMRGDASVIQKLDKDMDVIQVDSMLYGHGKTGRSVTGMSLVLDRTYPFMQESYDCRMIYRVNRFAYTPYVIDEDTGAHLVSKTSVLVDGTGNAVSTKETYRYDGDATMPNTPARKKYRMMVSKTTARGAETIRRDFVYAYHLDNNAAFPTNVREEAIRNNGDVIAARIINYTQTYPTQIFIWKSEAPKSNFVVFDGLTRDPGYGIATNEVLIPPDISLQYDGQKRMQYVRGTDGISTAYITDAQSNNIVSTIRNCDNLQNVAYASFETQAHNFVIGKGDAANAISGAYGFNLGILSSVTMPKLKYNVELWYNSSIAGPPIVIAKAGTASYPVTTESSGTGTWKRLKGTIDLTLVSSAGPFSFEISGSGVVDEVRIYPADAEMSTFVHKPLVGVSSVMDSAGRLMRYEYYPDNRLKTETDEDGNVIKMYKYNLVSN